MYLCVSKQPILVFLYILVIPPWYYVGPIIAVACVVLLVGIIFVVRRVLHSRGWKPAEEKCDFGKKDLKVS